MVIIIIFDSLANEWGKISLEAKELISKMLSYNPGLRMSAVEALNDPWI